MDKRAKLRKKWRGRVKFERRLVGARCPSCGYVYTNGFSTLTSSHGPSGLPGDGETLTLCTRCRKVLAVPDAEGRPLRLLSPVELLLLNDADQRVFAELRELFEAAGDNRWS